MNANKGQKTKTNRGWTQIYADRFAVLEMLEVILAFAVGDHSDFIAKK
jgi:hypothetical protein